MKDDTKALKVNTEINTGDITKIKEEVKEHSSKHKQLEAENALKDQKIEAQVKSIEAVESENKQLKLDVKELEKKYNNLSARVDALLGHQEQAVAGADNAAQNAERLAQRAAGQEVLGQKRGDQGDLDNQHEPVQDNGEVPPAPDVNAQEDQAGGKEADPARARDC